MDLIMSAIPLSWVAQVAGCQGSGASSLGACSDDSGPNLLVRSVAFLLAAALAGAGVWVVQRVRRAVGRRHHDNHAADDRPGADRL